MRLFRSFELLRAPEGEGGATPPVVTIVAETAPIVAVAPLTVDPAPTNAGVEGGVAAPPAVEAAVVPAAPAAGAELAVGPSEGLLSGAKSITEIKAAPAAPADSSPAPVEGGTPAPDAVPAKPAEKVEPQPLPPIAYEAFTIPKGAESLDSAKMKAFTDLLASDPESRVSQKLAQALLQMHTDQVVEQIKLQEQTLVQARDKYWANQNAAWQKEVREDPKLRNRLEYNLAVAKTAILQESASEKDAEAILQHMILNGFTNFPPFIRMMVNIGEKLNVMEDDIVAPTAPVSGATKSRADKWYGQPGQSDGMTPKA